MVDFLKEFRVPTDSVAKNLEWRIKMREKANFDVGLQRAIKYACAHDIAYFCSAWCYVFEPRTRRALPFILWPHQETGFREVEKVLGGYLDPETQRFTDARDIVVVKSRDEGWSFALCTFAYRDLLFKEMAKIGLVSSTEKKVDDPGNLGSLFGKIDWCLKRLPLWMVGIRGDASRNIKGDWYRNASKHSYNHEWTGSQLNGFAGTPEAPRGDRYLWFGIDEHASDDWKKDNNDEKLMDATQATTNCRWFVSTPNGPSGAFHDIAVEPNNALKLYISWRDNPTKNRGLYRMVNGKPEAMDPVNNPLPPEYNPPDEHTITLFSQLRKRGFSLDKGTRSPWYDQQCLRPHATPMGMAKEYDLSFGGSVEQVFGDRFMTMVKETADAKQPVHIGNFIITDDKTLDGEFDINPTGNMLLWCPLDSQGRPPRSKYVIAADIASGNGGKYTSNSVIQVLNMETKEQVLEYATNVVKPEQLADMACALGKWFYNAYLSWESNNLGGGFGARALEREYPDCFTRKTYNRKTRASRTEYGFHTGTDTKEIMFTRLRTSVLEGDLIIRSKQLVEEFKQYVRDEKQRIDFAGHFMDAAHGDRVMALGVALMAMEDRPTIKREEGTYSASDDPPLGTMAYREKMYQDEDARDEDPWVEYEPADMMGMGRYR